MKILIVAGGGGHFAAALAVIEQLPKDWEVTVIGRKYAFEADKTISLEYQAANKLGIAFIPLTTGRLQRKISLRTVSSLLKLPKGLFQALRIVHDLRPAVVLSFGGYVSVPVGLAAMLMRVPIIIHEQVLGAGLANTVIGAIAHKVCISWKESETCFPKGKTVLTGLPIRKFSVSKFDYPISKESLPLIYITGGSGGAHGINKLIEQSLETLLAQYRIIHQTGDSEVYGDYNRLIQRRVLLPEAVRSRYVVEKFIAPSAVGLLMQKADVVISRAGINTVAELLYFGKPCLLIPLPYGQHNEQLTNARLIERAGLAVVLDQTSLTTETFLAAVKQMFADYDRFLLHVQAAKELIHADAAEKIITIVRHATQKTKE